MTWSPVIEGHQVVLPEWVSHTPLPFGERGGGGGHTPGIVHCGWSFYSCLITRPQVWVTSMIIKEGDFFDSLSCVSSNFHVELKEYFWRSKCQLVPICFPAKLLYSFFFFSSHKVSGSWREKANLQFCVLYFTGFDIMFTFLAIILNFFIYEIE